MTRAEAIEKSEEVREQLAGVRLRPTNLVRTVHTLFQIQFMLLDLVDFLLEQDDREIIDEEVEDEGQEAGQMILVPNGTVQYHG